MSKELNKKVCEQCSCAFVGIKKRRFCSKSCASYFRFGNDPQYQKKLCYVCWKPVTWLDKPDAAVCSIECADIFNYRSNKKAIDQPKYSPELEEYFLKQDQPKQEITTVKMMIKRKPKPTVTTELLEELRLQSDLKKCLICNNSRIPREFRHDLLFIKDRVSIPLCRGCYFTTRYEREMKPYKVI